MHVSLVLVISCVIGHSNVTGISINTGNSVGVVVASMMGKLRW